MSHLDKFLLSKDRRDLFPEVCQLTLPKLVSDHCPIIWIHNVKDGALSHLDLS